MTWTDPVNVSAGTTAKASQVNLQVFSNLRFLHDTPACSVSRAAALSLVDNTWTPIGFDTEERDNAAMHSTSANTDRLTAPIAGLYVIHARIAIPNAATGAIGVRLKRSDGVIYRLDRRPLASIVQYLGGSREISLTAGQYVTVEVNQSSGGALSLDLADNGVTAQMRWVSPNT